MSFSDGKRTKASTAQLSHLADYMAAHPEMGAGLPQSLQDRADLEKAWQSLTATLNCLGGPIKTASKWKQAWRDLRNNLKRRCPQNKDESTGNSTDAVVKDKCVVKRQVSVEPVPVFGMPEVVATEPPDPLRVKKEEMEIKVIPLPEPTTKKPQKRIRIRKRIMPKHDNLDSKLLEIEEEKLHLKRKKIEIEEERNALLHRIADSLQHISNKLK